MTAATPMPGLDLDDQLCFALYSAQRSLTARYRPMLAKLGLTYPQYLVMLVLWEADRERQSLTVGSLGERLHLDSGTLSPLLKRLEALGVLTRSRSVEDERAVDVQLTTRGRRLRQKAVPIPEQICAATGFTIADLVRLKEELHELRRSVSAEAV